MGLLDDYMSQVQDYKKAGSIGTGLLPDRPNLNLGQQGLLSQMQSAEANYMGRVADPLSYYQQNPEAQGLLNVSPELDLIDLATGGGKMAMAAAIKRAAKNSTTKKPNQDIFSEIAQREVAASERELAASEAEKLALPSSAPNRQDMGVNRATERNAKTGKYTGGPSHVSSPEQLQSMREEYIDSVTLGAEGAEWYDRSSDFIDRASGQTLDRGVVADSLAVTSAGSTVDTNLGHTIKAVNQDAMGTPIRSGRFPVAMSNTMQESFDGKKPFLGAKRGPFRDNLETSWSGADEFNAVHDIWQGRAFGYTDKNGKPWDAGFSPQQHAFMDDEIDSVVQYLNENKVGGRTDWNPKNTQAAAWTGIKIKFGDINAEDAAVTFADYMNKYAANATYEQIPGLGTGVLPGLDDMSWDARKAYTDTAKWTNEKGQDTIYEGGGLLTDRTNDMVGAYTPTGGKLEINPGEVAKPYVQSTESILNPESVQALDMGENARAYVDAQNAGAWHRIIPSSQKNNPIGERNSLHIPMSQSPNANQMTEISRIADENGFFAVDTGEGINLIDAGAKEGSVGFERTGVSLGKELKGDLGQEIVNAMGVTAERVNIVSGFENYQDAWSAGSGSKKATIQFLESLSKNEKFASNIEPALRKKAAANLKRDAQFSQEYALPVREDIQTARKIFSEKGRAGLIKAIKSGAILPALAAMVVAPQALKKNDDSQTET